jgi:hypothetical protein
LHCWSRARGRKPSIPFLYNNHTIIVRELLQLVKIFGKSAPDTIQIVVTQTFRAPDGRVVSTRTHRYAAEISNSVVKSRDKLRKAAERIIFDELGRDTELRATVVGTEGSTGITTDTTFTHQPVIPVGYKNVGSKSRVGAVLNTGNAKKVGKAAVSGAKVATRIGIGILDALAENERRVEARERAERRRSSSSGTRKKSSSSGTKKKSSSSGTRKKSSGKR